MFDKKIRLFLKKYQIVSFSEEQIIPLLEDFLDKCYNAKRKRLKTFEKTIPELNPLDKDLVQGIKNSYNLGIYFATNPLSEGLENTEDIIDIVSEFATFCINPSTYDKPKKNSFNTIRLSKYECYS